ncbi:hypothetical protein [Prosthecomicrobium sp. N25]|uniref:hypothetical protein n=1 Tax=Prosthecomicrobium sp. N25 TaxID=3129254 RepID=UPI003076FF6B
MAAVADISPEPRDRPTTAAALDPRVLTVLIGAAFLNAEFGNIYDSVARWGWATALFAAFEISGIVWIAVAILLGRLARLPALPLSAGDVVVFAAVAALVLYPVPQAAWAGLTLAGVWLLARADRAPGLRRTASLVLALAFAGLWGRLIFRLFLDPILLVDTTLVAWAAGLPFNGNVIEAADGKSVLKVLEGCSSFANLSLAVLGWVAARTWFGASGWRRTLLFLPISMAAVMAINTTRIALIALHPDQYGLLHGPVGTSVAGLATTIAIFAISIAGNRR